MFTTREQIRIADQSIAAASQLKPPDKEEGEKKKSALPNSATQQQLERPCTKSQQQGQQHQQ